MKTEPEQWALELEAQKIADAVCGDYAIRKHSLEWSMCKAAALSALRAFEERERKLRAEMAVVQQSHDWMYGEKQRLENALKDIASRAHANLAQALKETPDAQ